MRAVGLGSPEGHVGIQAAPWNFGTKRYSVRDAGDNDRGTGGKRFPEKATADGQSRPGRQLCANIIFYQSNGRREGHQRKKRGRAASQRRATIGFSQ